MIEEIKYIVPELFIIFFSICYLMIATFSYGKSLIANSNNLSALSLIIAAVILFYGQEIVSEPVMGGYYTSNDFTTFFKGMILILSAVILHLSDDYLKKNNLQIFEFPILVNFAVVGMMIIVSSNDLMALYIGIEMQSLSLYILAAFSRDNAKSTEAGLKYFILGALSSGLLLYGVSLVYGTTGSTQFNNIYETIMYTDSLLGLQVGMVFIISSIAFKFSAFPFHMWTPDVYEGAPTPVTAFMAIVPKLAIGGMFAKVLFDIFGGVAHNWQLILVFLSGGSMIIGAFGAIAQTNIKRMLAFSSIGHVGFALMGLAAVSPEGLSGFIIYLFLYSIMMIGMLHSLSTWKKWDL